MTKEQFIKLMKQYGDAYVTYVSPNSKKEKFNVGTIDLDNTYIKEKMPAKYTVDEDKVLMFCWDTDSFRQVDANTVVRVDSLFLELEKASMKRHGRRNFNRNNL